MDVKTIMDTWTLQMGFPVVTITRIGSTDKAKATQKHFLLDPNTNVTVTSQFKWAASVVVVFVLFITYIGNFYLFIILFPINGEWYWFERSSRHGSS